jgi:PTS system mannitol-specific IIA component/PTS system ascorbate-specific IIA component
MKFLNSELISLDVEADSPEAAIRQAGDLIVSSGAAAEEYVEAMIASYRSNGAYFVVAPGIALPHAKSEKGVIEGAVSFIRLKRPIAFGHALNDPVKFVFAIGGTTGSEHIDLLKKLTVLLNDRQNIEDLGTADSIEKVESILRGVRP